MRLRLWPKRWDIAGLCFLALLIALSDRIIMSVAAPILMQERHWNTAQMGWVLSGFYIGYAFLMIPVGILADRYGPRNVLAWGVGCWSLFTALTPLPQSLPVLALTRCIMGVGQSGVVPCINGMLARWFPSQEYSRAIAISW